MSRVAPFSYAHFLIPANVFHPSFASHCSPAECMFIFPSIPLPISIVAYNYSTSSYHWPFMKHWLQFSFAAPHVIPPDFHCIHFFLSHLPLKVLLPLIYHFQSSLHSFPNFLPLVLFLIPCPQSSLQPSGGESRGRYWGSYYQDSPTKLSQSLELQFSTFNYFSFSTAWNQHVCEPQISE